METKICSLCKKELPLDMFHVKSGNKDGYSGVCKECKSKQNREYRIKNKELLKEKNKQYREKNQDSIKEKKKKYYQEHKEEMSVKSAEYRSTHKEAKAAQDKKYAQEHKEQIQQYQKEYREIHRLSNSEYQKQYREKNKERLSEYKKSPHNRYMVYKRNAEKRNLNFDMSEDEFLSISKLPCIYCGEYSDTYCGEQFNGVDRIDSSIGYQKDNCVPCCATCNKMKMEYDVNNWINKMIQIIDNLKSNPDSSLLLNIKL